VKEHPGTADLPPLRSVDTIHRTRRKDRDPADKRTNADPMTARTREGNHGFAEAVMGERTAPEVEQEAMATIVPLPSDLAISNRRGS